LVENPFIFELLRVPEVELQSESIQKVGLHHTSEWLSSRLVEQETEVTVRFNRSA
jgi:hypothetical protein